MSDEAKNIMTVKELKELLNDRFRDTDIVNFLDMNISNHLEIANVFHSVGMNWTCSHCKFIKSSREDKKNWICEKCYCNSLSFVMNDNSCDFCGDDEQKISVLKVCDFCSKKYNF